MKIMRVKRMKIWKMRTKITSWHRFSSRSARTFKKMKDCVISLSI